MATITTLSLYQLNDRWLEMARGSSGHHRTTYRVTPERSGIIVTIRATETSRFKSGETGNLYVVQIQIGQKEFVRFVAEML